MTARLLPSADDDDDEGIQMCMNESLDEDAFADFAASSLHLVASTKSTVACFNRVARHFKVRFVTPHPTVVQLHPVVPL